jgi:hypothetical protein
MEIVQTWMFWFFHRQLANQPIERGYNFVRILRHWNVWQSIKLFFLIYLLYLTSILCPVFSNVIRPKISYKNSEYTYTHSQVESNVEHEF